MALMWYIFIRRSEKIKLETKVVNLFKINDKNTKAPFIIIRLVYLSSTLNKFENVLLAFFRSVLWKSFSQSFRKNSLKT